MPHAQVSPSRNPNYIDTARASTDNPSGSDLDDNPFFAHLLQSGQKMADFLVSDAGYSATNVNKMTHLDMQNAIRLFIEDGGDFTLPTITSNAAAPSGSGAFVGAIWFKNTSPTAVHQWDGDSWQLMATGA